MRVMVALENRFLRTQNGSIYSTTVCDYNFWCRYLQVFDEVIVFARVAETPDTKLEKPSANGPGVCFLALPTFIGPWQYIRNYYRLNSIAKKALSKAQAYILRIPGAVSTLLWHHLEKNQLPYAVEVVGDPWDSLGPGNVKSVLRPLIRRKMTRDTVQQCCLASVASYVTEYSLQKRYPPGCWSTHYSSVELLGDVVINDSALEDKISKTKAKLGSNIPFRICHVGMMEHLYKAPDVLLNAVAVCIGKGLNIELILVGDGRFRPQLEKKTQKLGITDKVKFLGKLAPGQAVYNELDKSDLYILPSRQEGLPRSVIEAMARGLPCIGSNVGGMPELLDAEDLVSPGNVRALAEKIESVVKSENKLEKMTRRNVQTAKKYKADEINQCRTEFYKKVAEVASALRH